MEKIFINDFEIKEEGIDEKVKVKEYKPKQEYPEFNQSDTKDIETNDDFSFMNYSDGDLPF